MTKRKAPARIAIRSAKVSTFDEVLRLKVAPTDPRAVLRRDFLLLERDMLAIKEAYQGSFCRLLSGEPDPAYDAYVSRLPKSKRPKPARSREDSVTTSSRGLARALAKWHVRALDLLDRAEKLDCDARAEAARLSAMFAAVLTVN